jgi:hypothetical protein
MTGNTATQRTTAQAANKTALRPFQVNVPEAELTELRRRIKATKWPERETVTDATQGVQLAFIQALARYWATDYNWRRCEAQLNSHPQFITEIDGFTSGRDIKMPCRSSSPTAGLARPSSS